MAKRTDEQVKNDYEALLTAISEELGDGVSSVRIDTSQDRCEQCGESGPRICARTTVAARTLCADRVACRKRVIDKRAILAKSELDSQRDVTSIVRLA
jgi:hypothetical protein